MCEKDIINKIDWFSKSQRLAEYVCKFIVLLSFIMLLNIFIFYSNVDLVNKMALGFPLMVVLFCVATLIEGYFKKKKRNEIIRLELYLEFQKNAVKFGDHMLPVTSELLKSVSQTLQNLDRKFKENKK